MKPYLSTRVERRNRTHMEQIQRARAIFAGTVQGVGFRFTAERIALRLNMTGFARNLPNGTVEIICEGEIRQIKAFLDEIEESMYGYISDSSVEWEPARGEFSSFDIKF